MNLSAPVSIRAEAPGDADTIAAVVEAAFGQPAEARLVAAIRASGARFISLVATVDTRVIGHLMLSPVTVDGRAFDPSAMGLAPVSVAPDWQSRGVGSQLIERGLALCDEGQTPFVMVLGHPTYYPRFGFVQASLHGLRYIEPVPDEAFMVRPHPAGDSGIAAGAVRYLPVFEQL